MIPTRSYDFFRAMNDTLGKNKTLDLTCCVTSIDFGKKVGINLEKAHFLDIWNTPSPTIQK